MKRLVMIGGTMGVGKSAVSSVLKYKWDQSVMLDGDWCWDMHPFIVNEETKNMVLSHITYQLNSFLKCSCLETVIFCWVMHEQSIIDDILSRLDLHDCRVYPISLICDAWTLKHRLQKDIDQGLRQEDIIEKSLERMNKYPTLHTHLIDTTHLSIEETAQQIKEYIQKCEQSS